MGAGGFGVTEDIFRLLPKVGKSIQIPTGIIWCDAWEVNESQGRTEGKIEFRFVMDSEKYHSIENGPITPVHAIEPTPHYNPWSKALPAS